MLNLNNLKPLNLNQTEEKLKTRGYHLNTDEVLRLYNEKQHAQTNVEAFNHQRNHGTFNPNDKVVHAAWICKQTDLEAQWAAMLLDIPNLPHESCPIGTTAMENRVITTKYTYEPCNPHEDYVIAAKNAGVDTVKGTQLTSPRFAVYLREAAYAHRCLVNRALDYYTTLGYNECIVPLMVNTQTMTGTAQLPKFKEELFTTQHHGQTYHLIPTGEVPVTNLVAHTMAKNYVDSTNAWVTHTPCFRKEAGAAGKDTKGILRQHQFEKVELVRTCLPEYGEETLMLLLNHIVSFIDTLPLNYRIIELCTGDMGFAGHKAFDIEVWFPHQNTWREIASITWCHDFQARRMNAKYKIGEQKGYLHTLNGTGLAVGRVLAALWDMYGVEGLAKANLLRQQ